MRKNNIVTNTSKPAVKTNGQYSTKSKNNHSVSHDDKWTSLSKKVLRENMGAWETLAKE